MGVLEVLVNVVRWLRFSYQDSSRFMKDIRPVYRFWQIFLNIEIFLGWFGIFMHLKVDHIFFITI